MENHPENQNQNEENLSHKESLPEENPPIKKQSNISLPAAIVLAGVIVAGAILISNSAPKSPINPLTPSSDKKDLAIPEVTEEDFIKGDKNAEITLIEYADFSCGFCAHYHPTLEKIVADYDGKVKWVYRHLPIFNKPAAVSSSCVGNTLGDEKFFMYAATLYKNQKDINGDLLKREALALGMNEGDYDACINDAEVSDKISKDFTSVRVLAGFNATPYTVLVDKEGNMYPFSGALPYEDVANLIDTFIK